MKILNNVHIPKIIKSLTLTTPLVLITAPISSKPSLECDVFEKSQNFAVDFFATSKVETPLVVVGGEDVYPAVVVDLSDNTLYYYDFEGFLECSYPVASGKKTSPTKTGLKIITAIEDYPYDKAYKGTRRYKRPNDYGPKVICLAPVDLETGKILDSDGQFIHGTNKPSSIGQKASLGCIRMFNEDVEILASKLDVGQYVLVQE